MPKFNFLSGKMANNNISDQEVDTVADRATKTSYQAGEMASRYMRDWNNSTEEELADLFERTEDLQNREKYGYAYLMKKYSSHGWTPFIKEVYTSTGTYGIDSKTNPFIKIMNKLGSLGKALNDTAQQTLANILYEDPDEALKEGFYLYQIKEPLDNLRKWTDSNQQAEALNILNFLHNPRKMSDWREEPLTADQISEIESKKDFEDFKSSFLKLEDPDASKKQRVSKPKQQTKLSLADLTEDDIDWRGVPKANKELLLSIFKELKRNAELNYR